MRRASTGARGWSSARHRRRYVSADGNGSHSRPQADDAARLDDGQRPRQCAAGPRHRRGNRRATRRRPGRSRGSPCGSRPRPGPEGAAARRNAEQADTRECEHEEERQRRHLDARTPVQHHRARRIQLDELDGVAEIDAGGLRVERRARRDVTEVVAGSADGRVGEALSLCRSRSLRIYVHDRAVLRRLDLEAVRLVREHDLPRAGLASGLGQCVDDLHAACATAAICSGGTCARRPMYLTPASLVMRCASRSARVLMRLKYGHRPSGR